MSAIPASPVPPHASDFLPPAHAPVNEPMTPFVKIERQAAVSMVQRAALLDQPDEFFRQFFGGRLPTLAEKITHVEQMVQRMAYLHVYQNNLYHVEMAYGTPFIHLDIHRLDGGPCKNWRHFQQIKNELVGAEHEAIELFPAESRLVDTANEYHLWVHARPDFRFPVGWNGRLVMEKPVFCCGSAMPTDRTGGGGPRTGTAVPVSPAAAAV